MRRFFPLAMAALLFLIPVSAKAGTYPDHPVTVLTMTGPGAQIDLLTRALADRMKDILANLCL